MLCLQLETLNIGAMSFNKPLGHSLEMLGLMVY